MKDPRMTAKDWAKMETKRATNYIFDDGHRANEPAEVEQDPSKKEAWLAELVEKHGRVIISGKCVA